MFSTFTGNSRRPRQVNLSGRSSKPLTSSGAAKGQAAVLASAQQDRIQRQKERQRQVAAKLLQKVWRGYSARKKVRGELRGEWDAVELRNEQSRENDDEKLNPYESQAESFLQVQRLLRYALPSDAGDVQRLLKWFARHQKGIQQSYIAVSGASWEVTHMRVQKLVLSFLKYHNMNDQPAIVSGLLAALIFTAEHAPEQTSMNSNSYYYTLASLIASTSIEGLPPGTTESFLQSLIAPFRVSDENILQLYENFALQFMTVPLLHVKLNALKLLDFIAEHLKYRVLEGALAEYFEDVCKPGRREIQGAEARLWLLAYFIYIRQYTYRYKSSKSSSGSEYISVVSALLSSVAAHYDFDHLSPSPDQDQAQVKRKFSAHVDRFPYDQILSLINEESIRNLLAQSGALIHTDIQGSSEVDKVQARKFGRYALNLLQIFPHRGDDIRMWLYLGSSSPGNTSGGNCHVSALRFFWKSARETSVFGDIFRQSKQAITVLRDLFRFTQGPAAGDDVAFTGHAKTLEDEWSIIVIFLELYSFVLRIMDDDEFFSPLATMGSQIPVSKSARNNVLLLEDVRNLSIFLKHLGFTMYFNGPEILLNNEIIENTLVFKQAFAPVTNQLAKTNISRADDQADGSTMLSVGFSMDYLKNLVTSLLRAIYDRDSRRRFTPRDHWLMRSRLEMTGFIAAVVSEEEKSHQLLDLDDDGYDEELRSTGVEGPVIGAGRVQSTQGIDRIKFQQNRTRRKRDKELVTPRLEILQNMPYLISFHTRVQIFREFVHQDQYKRRNGVIDPDMWRWSLVGHSDQRDRMEKHQAKIRRYHEFDDAYEHFYQLGDGLKEPIYITFVDQFGNVEAGIDGGGVTKEFLTSVTSQAFEPVEGLNPFITNDKHLLYPNPIAMAEYKEQLRRVGIKEDSPEFRLSVMGLLQKYEFLGRILGKCLYEGILVDLNFAPFFLLKWALTGGTSSAPRESNYRANLNDLRDLDEALYQGLLHLKNYQGSVEDFALNFTVTDTITVDYNTGKSMNVTQDLKPNGSDIPVTNENRLFYVSYISRYRLQTQPYPQTSAFLKGLSAIIQPSWLAMFNQSELQTLISGTSSAIDLADLRRHTEYGGVYVIGDDHQEHPSVMLFWKVMKELTDEEQRAVLKFVTSTPRAPLLGFGSLNPKFTIRDAGGDEDRLPSTSTCVNLLKLPRYSKETVLKEKLLYSAFSGAGFDLS